MQAFVFVVVFALAAQCSVAEDEARPSVAAKRMGAVVSTMQDMLQALDDQEKKESANHKCFVRWCDTEISDKGSDISGKKDFLADLTVSVSEFQSSMANFQNQLRKDKKQYSSLQDELRSSEEVRKEEVNKYIAERDTNRASVTSLKQAIKITERSRVQLVQVSSDSQAPSQEGGFVSGVFQGLLRQLTSSGDKADLSEKKQASMYEAMTDSKQSLVTMLQKALETKQMLYNEAARKNTEASNDMSTTTRDLADDARYLRDVNEDCAAKKADFTARSKDRADEKTALGEAISFLSISIREMKKKAAAAAAAKKKKKSLLDASDDADDVVSFVETDVDQSEFMRKAAQAVASLDTDVSKLVDQARQEAASQNRQSGIFAKINKTINGMIAELKKDQEADLVKRNWCQAELKSKGEEQATQKDTHQQLAVGVNKKRGEIAEFTAAVKTLNDAIKLSKSSVSTARKLRLDAKKIFDAGTKDRELSVRVVKEARSVLAKFYRSKSSSKSAQARRSTEGNVVVAMLEKIIGDIRKEQQHAAKGEKKAVSMFQKLVEDDRTNYDDRMEKITQAVTRRAKLEVQLGAAKEDKTAVQKSLKSVSDELTALNGDCGFLIKSFETMRKARRFNIDQLTDAMHILSGAKP